MKWKSVNLCENQIKARTVKSVLVKMPLSSKYKGFLFWHPSKLVKTSYYRGESYELLYTDDFTFNLFKNGKGKTNKYEKIAEKCIDVEDFEEAFKVVGDDRYNNWNQTLWLKNQLVSVILHTKFENSSLGVEKLSFSLGLVLIFRKISYSTTMEICYR